MKTGDPIVFVVEDDSSMREALTDLITSVGLSVEAFKSAREFLEHRRPNAPACLVLDVRLPGLSGLDLQRELVRTEALFRSYSLPAMGISRCRSEPLRKEQWTSWPSHFVTRIYSTRFNRLWKLIELPARNGQWWLKCVAVTSR